MLKMMTLDSSCGLSSGRRLTCRRRGSAQCRLERLVDIHGLLKLVKLNKLRHHGGRVDGVRRVLRLKLRCQKRDKGAAGQAIRGAARGTSRTAGIT